MLPDSPRIVIVDDDPVTCELLAEVFAHEGFLVRSTQSGEAALKVVSEEHPDVLVSDIRMKTPLDGLLLLDHMRREFHATPVVLMTAFGSIDTAVRAVKEGAFDYISKPFDIDTLVATVRRAISDKTRESEPVPALHVEEEEQKTGLVGRNPAMLEIYKTIARVSDSGASVLITGESGTGKELVARAIHSHSPRYEAPFVAVNCGAITETLLESELFGHVRGSFTGAIANKRGIFEQAGEGTVFLDEVSETSTALQVKLLRVLQERELVPVGGAVPIKVRARVIAAASADLEELSAAGNFRRELLYRLNVINIHLPPLRERKDDIPLLVQHLLRKHTPEGRPVPEIDREVLERLTSYSWPGNVRELENAIERAVTLTATGIIRMEDLPAKVREDDGSSSPGSKPDDLAPLFSDLPTIDELERRYLIHVLEATGDNRTRAAEVLGINRKTLYRMAARFNIG